MFERTADKLINVRLFLVKRALREKDYHKLTAVITETLTALTKKYPPSSPNEYFMVLSAFNDIMYRSEELIDMHAYRQRFTGNRVNLLLTMIEDEITKGQRNLMLLDSESVPLDTDTKMAIKKPYITRIEIFSTFLENILRLYEQMYDKGERE